MTKKVLIISVLMMCFPMTALAEKIVFAVLEDFPPYQYKDKEQLTGSGVDITREICKRLGLEPEFQVVPWSRALKLAENGDVSGLPSALRTPEREKFLFYTSETIHVQKNVIFIKKESSIRITSLDDLKGKTVGVVRGFSYGPVFDNYQGLKKEVCNEQKELIVILDKGRIDSASIAEAPFWFMCKGIGIQNAQDRFKAAYIISENPAYTVFSKALGQKGEQLAQKFDQMLKQLKTEGVVQQIENRYR